MQSIFGFSFVCLRSFVIFLWLPHPRLRFVGVRRFQPELQRHYVRFIAWFFLPLEKLSGSNCLSCCIISGCKNFLTCSNGVCLEPTYHANCSAVPCLWPLSCFSSTGAVNQSVCDVIYRENGDPCAFSVQCLSGSCVNGTCRNTANEGGSCDLSTVANAYSCPQGTVCLRSDGNSFSCAAPLPLVRHKPCGCDLFVCSLCVSYQNASCFTAMNDWNSLPATDVALLPLGICAAGLVCTQVNASAAFCLSLFASAVNSTCYNPTHSIPDVPVPSIDVTCRYNLTCSVLSNTCQPVATNCTAVNVMQSIGYQ